MQGSTYQKSNFECFYISYQILFIGAAVKFGMGSDDKQGIFLYGLTRTVNYATMIGTDNYATMIGTVFSFFKKLQDCPHIMKARAAQDNSEIQIIQ
jgi:hypothetical protein